MQSIFGNNGKFSVVSKVLRDNFYYTCLLDIIHLLTDNRLLNMRRPQYVIQFTNKLYRLYVKISQVIDNNFDN